MTPPEAEQRRTVKAPPGIKHSASSRRPSWQASLYLKIESVMAAARSRLLGAPASRSASLVRLSPRGKFDDPCSPLSMHRGICAGLTGPNRYPPAICANTNWAYLVPARW